MKTLNEVNQSILEKFSYGVCVIILIVNSMALASEKTSSVLDYQSHPESPEYKQIHPLGATSLDTTLSWKNRFNGDETFNESEALPQRASVIASSESEQPNMNHTMEMKMDGMGIVKSVRAEQGKVKISHGPIEKFGMPKMTMMFRVEDPSILESVEEGQEIGFNVDNSSGGFVVTHIMPAMKMEMEMSADEGRVSEMDARGKIKSIRLSQGKIKIEHGPIEKYGMPSMTMMFKVKDASILEGLEPDTEIDFDVDNSSGGFEVTNIKLVGQ